MDAWVERELDGGALPDRRLKARLGRLLVDLGRRVGGTLPTACQDWAATKAAYRFFDNARVDEDVTLAGHFAATAARFSAVPVRVRFATLAVHPTPAKRKRCPSLTLNVIDAVEPGRPAGREPIRWRLLTNCPVPDLASAVEKLNWYSLRWKIETFHKVLKSGCQAEQSKLRTTERLTNLLAVLCVIGWRVFWLTMAHRAQPDAPADTAFTPTEVAILDHLSGPTPPPPRRTLTIYVTALAKLGGYLARAHDPPPGNMVLWRGLTRLTDICLGLELCLWVIESRSRDVSLSRGGLCRRIDRIGGALGKCLPKYS